MEKEKIKYSKFKSYRNFKKNKTRAESGLEIEFGDRGCGKSAEIAHKWYKFDKQHKKGHGFYCQYDNFYTNVAMTVEDPKLHILDLTNHKLTDYFDPNDPLYSKYKISTYDSINPPPFFIQKNSVICLDELGIIAHSRDYAKFPQQFVSLMKCLRKCGIYMIANSQDYSVDKTIRQAAQVLRIRRKFLNFSYSRRINKWIDINRGDDSEADTQIVDKIDFAPIFQKDAIKFCFIPFYTDLYDTYL